MIYTTDIIGDQWKIFLEAIKLGTALGGVYDIARILRVFIHSGKKFFIATDLIYWFFSAFIIFSFLLEKNFGIPRFYIFLGIGTGFSLWYFTVGKINIKIAKKVKGILIKLFSPFSEYSEIF
jgi:spore cortex biosynthesis protein YabQ